MTNDERPDIDPVVSPDGRYIVFLSYSAGFPSIRRMDLDGGSLIELTDVLTNSERVVFSVTNYEECRSNASIESTNRS